jgi:hypothetical protein
MLEHLLRLRFVVARLSKSGWGRWDDIGGCGGITIRCQCEILVVRLRKHNPALWCCRSRFESRDCFSLSDGWELRLRSRSWFHATSPSSDPLFDDPLDVLDVARSTPQAVPPVPWLEERKRRLQTNGAVRVLVLVHPQLRVLILGGSETQAESSASAPRK